MTSDTAVHAGADAADPERPDPGQPGGAHAGAGRPAERLPRWPFWTLLGGAVVLAIAAVYAQVLGYGFLFWDDRWHIADNERLHTVTADNLWWMLTSADIDYWRPLSFLSHAVDFALWGDDGGGHHLSSLAIHGINALLVGVIAAICWRLTATAAPLPSAAGRARAERAGPGHGAAVAAVVAALVFAVHPQHVESAAWLAERKGILCVAFYLGAVCCYLAGRGEARGWRNATLVLFALALLSKPMAVSLPLTLVALDVYPLRRIHSHAAPAQWLRVLLEKWPYLALAALVALYTYVAVEAGGYLTDAGALGPVERGLNAARSVWLYPLRWLAPLGLSPLYPMAMADNSLNPMTLGAAAGLAVVMLLALVAFLRGANLLAGVLMAHLAVVGPILGLVHTGFQSSADRYGYLPGAIACVLAGVCLSRLYASLQQRAAWRGVVLVLVLGWVGALGVLAERQVGVWRSDITMWRTVMAYYPTWVPYPELTEGQGAYMRGDYARARTALNEALVRDQRPFDAHLYLALTLQALGESELAVHHIEQGLALVPDSAMHLRLAADAHLKGGRFDAARAVLARLRAVAPESVESLRQLAMVEFEAGNPERAEAILDDMLRETPEDPRTLVLRGVVAQLQGRKDEARLYYERVLAVQPSNRDARHNLAQLAQPATPATLGGG